MTKIEKNFWLFHCSLIFIEDLNLLSEEILPYRLDLDLIFRIRTYFSKTFSEAFWTAGVLSIFFNRNRLKVLINITTTGPEMRIKHFRIAFHFLCWLIFFTLVKLHRHQDSNLIQI